jgi:S1-C subfamily serine protease
VARWSPVTVLDLALLVMVVLSVLAGYRRGAVMQVAGLTGMALGLVAGGFVAPRIAAFSDDPWTQAGLALGALLVGGAIGSAAGSLVGRRLRDRTHQSRLSRLDAVGGSVLSALALVVTVWFLSLNLASGPFPELARQIRDSSMVRAIDAVMPTPPSLMGEIRRVLNLLGFPDVFVGLPPEPAAPVEPPTGAEARAAFRAVRDAVVEIEEPACGGIVQGSGFVVAPQLVVTNAHVVAGGQDLTIRGGGVRLDAFAVLFDPGLDIAFLHVDGLRATAVELLQSSVDRGRGGAVVGFPGGGPLTGRAAAVRRSLTAIGRDIYGRGEVRRDVIELQTKVRPGNSGGPFALEDGSVAGMVFANSTSDSGIGYAIESTEILPLLLRAESSTRAVGTGPCAN